MIIGHRLVRDETFLKFENELMKVPGISAVISVFGKDRLESCIELKEDIRLAASVLLMEGYDICTELECVNMDESIIEKAIVLDIRNHPLMDKSTAFPFEASFHKRQHFEEKLLRWKHTYTPDYWLDKDDSFWYSRTTALLSSRCSLQFPSDRYWFQDVSIGSRKKFASQVRRCLWKEVRDSELYCCVSKFFCSTLKNITNCKNCCGNCRNDDNGGLSSSEYVSDESDKNE